MSKPTYEELEAQVKQLAAERDAVVAESIALKDINAWCKTDAFKNMYREFKTAESLGCPDVDCMHDAMLVAIMHAPQSPATDAVIASLRAEAIEFAAYHLPSNGKYEDMILTLADEVREGLTEVKIPAPKYQSSQSEQVKGVQS